MTKKPSTEPHVANFPLPLKQNKSFTSKTIFLISKTMSPVAEDTVQTSLIIPLENYNLQGNRF